MVMLPMVTIDRDNHVLLYITRDFHSVHIILFAALSKDPLSLIRFIIIFEKKARMVHVINIEADIRPIDLHEEVIILHEKLAIVVDEVVGLAAKICRPLGTGVAPFAAELLET